MNKQLNHYDKTQTLADDLLGRALSIHDRSYRGGSFSEFYNAITHQFIETLSKQLINEAQTLANLHQRPLDKVLRAAEKSLTAIHAAIADQREAGAAERHVAPREFDQDDSNAIPTVPTNTSVKHQSSTSFRVRI